MADEKEDEFALTVPNGLPAYPKWVGDVVVNSPDEHKKLLAESGKPKSEAKAPEWSKK